MRSSDHKIYILVTHKSTTAQKYSKETKLLTRRLWIAVQRGFSKDFDGCIGRLGQLMCGSTDNLLGKLAKRLPDTATQMLALIEGFALRETLDTRSSLATFSFCGNEVMFDVQCFISFSQRFRVSQAETAVIQHHTWTIWTLYHLTRQLPEQHVLRLFFGISNLRIPQVWLSKWPAARYCCDVFPVESSNFVFLKVKGKKYF